jgi:DNA-binding NtrC family response regulator
MKAKALVIDDDALSREFLAEALATAGYSVSEAKSGEDGLATLRNGEPDLVLTDLRLPGVDGLAVLRGVKERFPDLPVVVLTAFGTVERAVEAMKAGAEDFLLKPVSPEQIDVVLERLQRRQTLVNENRVLRATLGAEAKGPAPAVGSNPRFVQALALAERVAQSEATVLVRGESGTGKEVVAALVHQRSPRAKGPFIRVNCAALTESLLTSELFGHEKGAFTGAHARREGRFELARGGTLFLDEIGELPPEVQAKLLRVLETKEYERVGGTQTLRADARVVAATNRDLEAGIRDSRFREDLYYRLNVVPVILPPLRERLDDIPALAVHFLGRFAREHGGPARRLSKDALAALKRAPWPGNVRELANTIQRAVLVAAGPEVDVQDLGLPDRVDQEDGEFSGTCTLEEMERRLILQTLDRTGWNRTEAARILDVTPRTLSNKLRLWRTLGLLPECVSGRKEETWTCSAR